jgi:hypothetical protein
MLTLPPSSSRAEAAEPQATTAPHEGFCFCLACLDAAFGERLSPEARETMLDEFAKLEADEPLDDPFDAPWQLPDAELAEFAEKARAFLESLQGLTLGDLIPSEEELNADPELEAWWADIPGAPRPRDSFAAPLPSLGYVAPVLRAGTRAREQRPQGRRRTSAAASRDGPKPSAGDDADPLDARRREAVAA